MHRQQQLTPQQVTQLFFLFGINIQQRLATARSWDEAKERLAQAKKEAKRSYKKKAFELHPDRNQNNPYAKDEFLELQQAWDVLEKIEINRPQHVTQVRIVVTGFGGGGVSTNTTTSTTSSVTGDYW